MAPLSTVPATGAGTSRGMGTVAATLSARASRAPSCPSFREERMVRALPRMVIFLHFSSIFRIRPPEVGAQEPFSIRATVRFWMLWATRSDRNASMHTKMPAL